MRSYRVQRWAVCGLIVLLGAGSSAGAYQKESPLSYMEKFEKIVKTVKQRFYDKELHKTDWDKTTAEYRAKLKAVKTVTDFTTLVNEMLDTLHASHFEYIPDDDMGFAMLRAVMGGGLSGNEVAHIGVMGTRQKGEFVVAGTLEGYPAEKAGIKSGDVLLSVNGKPFQTAGSFRDKEGKTVSLIFRRDGVERMTGVVPIKENPLQSFLTATKRSVKTLTIEGRKIGYVHLWTMANDEFRAALEYAVLNDLYATDGLILDLRDGYGGRPWGYADPFFMPDVTWEQFARGNKPVVSKYGYGKPMVVLINKGTRSAKEFVAYEFKKTKRAELIGTTTAGAFLGASTTEIGSDGVLELPVVGLRVDGKMLEGVGVEPDNVVEPKETYSENDAQMMEAKRVLMTKLNKSDASKTIGH